MENTIADTAKSLADSTFLVFADYLTDDGDGNFEYSMEVIERSLTQYGAFEMAVRLNKHNPDHPTTSYGFLSEAEAYKIGLIK